ncbi:MAG: sensor histidine kinase [Defluviitaleaceae bacterium]|nr:sensor histidine kinase [Defluviitaleaceae bacterium]
MTKLIKATKKPKIRTKLIIIYLVAGILPCLLISGLMIRNARTSLLEQRTEILRLDNQRVRSAMFSILYQSTRISDTIFFDEQTRQLVTHIYASPQDVSAMYRDYTLTQNLISLTPAISGIRIFVTNDSMISRGPFVVVDETVLSADWFNRAIHTRGEITWIYDTDIDNLGGLRLVRNIPLPHDEQFAVMVITISNNYLALSIEGGDLLYVLYLNEAQLFYRSHSITGRLEANDIFNRPFSIFDIELGGQTALGYAGRVVPFHSNDAFQILAFDATVYRDIASSFNMTLAMVVGVLIIPLLLIMWFTSNLSEEINRKELDQQKLINYQQEMEFKMLSSQINPHFLFNALETIRMKAVVDSQAEIAYIIKRLGSLMRHMIKAKDHMITLHSELENIHSYLIIQRFRFGERFNYEITVSPEIDTQNYMILPLLVQPIVENALIHGLENRLEDGWIKIDVFREDQFLMIRVEDNGTGFDEDIKAELKKRMENPKETPQDAGIGLSNTHQRIRMFYGNDYGVEINSKKNEGTVSLSRLPWEVNQ